jgi:hypothetical protein
MVSPAPPGNQAGLLLETFTQALSREVGLCGLFVGGSIALGDYRPGVSDIDAVAVLAARPTRRQRRRLRAVHRSLAVLHPQARRLHCTYAAVGRLDDLTLEHHTWAHERWQTRRLTAVARAEVLRSGVVLAGPPPAQLIPPVRRDDLASAARAELAWYAPYLRRRRVWLRDVWVDLGLTTLARADETIRSGELLTKSAAIQRLTRHGVPDGLVDQMARRRNGQPVHLTLPGRMRRARLVRRVLAAGIEGVLLDDR